LARALDIAPEELVTFEIEPTHDTEGKPACKDYLEADLPPDLRKAIDELVAGEAEGSTLWDCLWGEVYGSINANMRGGRITEEQAAYLRSKYLFDPEDEDDD
jgi:hypothetical protein